MLPKTESEMFSKSLVGQMILMIVLEENVPDCDEPPLLDRDGNKWILMAIFLVESFCYQVQRARNSVSDHGMGL